MSRPIAVAFLLIGGMASIGAVGSGTSRPWPPQLEPASPADSCAVKGDVDPGPLPPAPDKDSPVRDSLAPPAFTVAPHGLNPDALAQALRREMPSTLHTAGEQRVVLDLLIDRMGTVREVVVQKTSGSQSVDRMARRAACVIKFSPALKFDVPVAVWITFPLRINL